MSHLNADIIERKEFSMSFVACAHENRRAKKTVCNARGRYREIRSAQIKSQ